jgi:4-carboxymuconolactone decarboxylase
MSEYKSERFQKGWEKLKEIDGEIGEQVYNSLSEFSPDLAKLIIEYSFGDIYTREGLNLKSKEIAVVAALTAVGTAQPQLKIHLNAALNTGNSINEIKEVILQMSGYSGFPSSINAMQLLKEVLDNRKAQGIIDEIGKKATNKTSDRLKIG